MKTILLVEDNPNLGDLYQEELGEIGYHTLRASNGREALEQMAQHRPDLVIFDINMPGTDGFEVMEQMLAVQPGVPIIINSGYAGHQDSFRSWMAEAFVSKCSDLTELKSQIHRVLDLQAFQEFQKSKG
jgi:CheY-like chemotaxis protein